MSDLLGDFGDHLPFALLLATEAGMVNYVRRHARLAAFPQHPAHTLLYHALKGPYLGCLGSWEFRPSAKMVRLLLSTSSEPNAEFSRGHSGTKMTSWKYWRLEVHSFDGRDLLAEAAAITRGLLEAGAHSCLVDCRNLPDAEVEEIAGIREKGLELLRMVKDRQGGSTSGELLPPCKDD
ncbi:hypothetical protein F5Y19DRAFT_470247 [Xylariaceae sp. FL1651]|nr:hypothetical protein F5Y19DRAFT_470247 [Xylariaceae sp. FL1651]